MRNETALRLTIGNEATQVPIKVCDGLPIPLADALKKYDDLAELLLNEQAFTNVSSGLKIADGQFDELRQLLPCDFSKTELEKIGSWFDGIVGRLQTFTIKEELRVLNQDILGAYFFNSPRIEIYWAAIGIYAQLYNISVEGLCFVALAHELAHAYTHVGKDIDEEKWRTTDFAETDLPIVEGLAQFYTKRVCEKLAPRFPEGLEAYRALLKTQSPAYTEHENWIKDHPHLKEAIRFCMIQCRSQGVKSYGQFQEILHQVSALPFSSDYK